MRVQFWRKEIPNKQLSEELSSVLHNQFRLDPQVMTNLRYVERVRHNNNGTVKYVHIFDPDLIQGSPKKMIRTPKDLKAHRRAILFEGRIDPTGSIYLSDRRPMKLRARAI